MKQMEISYTKEGMKITHPTGVVQTLSIEDLQRIKNCQEQHKARINENIARLNKHITETQKIVN